VCFLAYSHQGPVLCGSSYYYLDSLVAEGVSSPELLLLTSACSSWGFCSPSDIDFLVTSYLVKYHYCCCLVTNHSCYCVVLWKGANLAGLTNCIFLGSFSDLMRCTQPIILFTTIHGPDQCLCSLELLPFTRVGVYNETLAPGSNSVQFAVLSKKYFIFLPA